MHTNLLSLAVLVFAGCPANTPPQPAADPVDETTRAFAQSVTAAMNPSVDACEDFYEHACGGWREATELPADRASYTRSFSTIDDRNKELVRDILQKAHAEAGDDADLKKLGDFYASCMDEAAIEELGAEPLRDTLAQIERTERHAAMFELAGSLGKQGYDLFLSGFVSADNKDPETNVLHMYQGGLGLPDKSFYQDEAKQPLVEAYQKHIAAQFVNLGDRQAEADARAERIVAFERTIADTHWDRVDVYDAEKTHNRLDREGLAKLAPDLPWDAYFTAIGGGDIQGINVATPSAIEGFQDVFFAADLPTLRDYAAWHVVQQSAPRLSSAFVNENFAFFGKTLAGQQELRPRWKRCVSATDGSLGHLVGRAYVKLAFPGDSKAQAKDLVGRVLTAFEGRVPELAWMDDATREAALGKANAVTPKIGYPDEGAWDTYPFEVSPTDYFGNVVRAQAHEAQTYLAKVDQPVDKREWFMNPHMVNAYYNPSANEIVFPAGILQPPMFDAAWPRAANYGAIGMVIGHELTHGFDDEGRKFDATGRMEPWWDESVITRFEERAECVVEAYNGYEVDGTAVNGQLTLGENIADIGGARLAYRAYQSWVADNAPETVVEGLTGDQLFFTAMAQAWCTVQSPELAQTLLAVDPHSPPRYRVNGTVQAMPEFAKAFGCEAGDAMVPAQTCEVW